MEQETAVKTEKKTRSNPDADSRSNLDAAVNMIRLDYGHDNDYFYTEAINSLRTNITFCGKSIQTILFTSTLPGEGKSETSFAVGNAFASIGKKVLYIDADIRKSMFAKRRSVRGGKLGLSQYLSGQKELQEVIYKTNIENLDVIMSGPYSPNPAELLEEQEFANLLKWAREYYDYILIDSPPMGNLIDAAIIGSHCDGAVLVVKNNAISYHLLQKVQDQLTRSGCKILGVALNRVNIKKGGKYYSYYQYGQYGKSGIYGAEK